MALHRTNRITAYEVAAVNRVTGQSIFVAVASGSKSRRMLRQVIFNEVGTLADKHGLVKTGKATRLDIINKLTRRDEWTWQKRAADGITSGDWSVKFTGRTALEVDHAKLQPDFTSIYDTVEQCAFCQDWFGTAALPRHPCPVLSKASEVAQ